MTQAIVSLPSPRPDLLIFEVRDKIHRDDIEGMAAQVDAAFEAQEVIDMLILMTDFEGATVGALVDPNSMAVQMKSVRHVRRYAVVGAPAWARAMVEVSDHLVPVEAKTFDLAEADQARAWVNAA